MAISFLPSSLPRFLPEVRLGTPALILAPMEGVTDAPMRALMSERGGFTFLVSEFMRISDSLPGARAFYDHMPELHHQALTPSGMPIQLQLLGGDAERLAQAAARACELGSPGIDLNFGCPAPTVNRHDGGATLLKYPERIEKIVRAVRTAVPAHLPVSAKLRLGWDDPRQIHLNAEKAALGGASWITIHGRTRMQGYQPPAYWKPIGEVRRRLGIPVVANGDIWTLDDLKRCQEETGGDHFMLGRSALADPDLPVRAARYLGLIPPAHRSDPALASEGIFPSSPSAWYPLLSRFAELSRPYVTDRGPNGHDGYALRRIKQWARIRHVQHGLDWFEPAKRTQTLPELFSCLNPY